MSIALDWRESVINIHCFQDDAFKLGATKFVTTHAGFENDLLQQLDLIIVSLAFNYLTFKI